jgi:hypothetical protein
MNLPRKTLSGGNLWTARQSLAMNWSEPGGIPHATRNRILWWDSKGYAQPYPRLCWTVCFSFWGPAEAGQIPGLRRSHVRTRPAKSG